MIKKFFAYTLLLLILTSCVNKAYVPTLYEPMLLNKKGQIRVSYAQTTSTAKMQMAYALKENIGLVANETFASGITNTEVGVSYFKNREHFYFELGGGLGYQSNTINYNERAAAGLSLFSSKYYTENFNCRYGSMFVSGCALWGGDGAKIGFGLKGGPLYINHYDYSTEVIPYLGKQNSTPLDHEQFKFNNAFTIIAEPSVFFVTNTDNRLSFRMQLGYTYSPGVYEHDYYFQQQWSSTPIISSSKVHPEMRKVNFSIGLTFKIFEGKE
jgi:hypothetical protein